MSARLAPRHADRQRGFTLVELMVALTIGLVLALGFAVSFVSLKSAFQTQDKLSQLQDNERLAMTFLTASVQEAGYFPQTAPPSQSRSTALLPYPNLMPASDTAKYLGTAAGQFLTGTSATASPVESISTIYTSASGDGLMTCQGGQNTSGSNAVIRNTFYVDANQTLGCIAYVNGDSTTAPGASFQPLVTNVQSMRVLYAVDTHSPSTGVADTYMTADLVTSGGYWNNVKAVRITLNFINPNAAATGQGTLIPWIQTINLMNNR